MPCQICKRFHAVILDSAHLQLDFELAEYGRTLTAKGRASRLLDCLSEIDRFSGLWNAPRLALNKVYTEELSGDAHLVQYGEHCV